MRGRVPRTLLVLALASLGLWAQVLPWLDPARVLVVYSTTFPDNNSNGVGDSLEVAQAYQAARGVPAQNILGVACSTSGVAYSSGASWSNFHAEVRDPVVATLSALGTTAVDTILFCHGVPYMVWVSGQGGRSLDQMMMTPWIFASSATPNWGGTWYFSNYFEASPTVGSSEGHFNHGSHTFSGTQMYLVARLDAPDVDQTLDLVEGALYGDLYLSTAAGAYQGTVYADTRYGSYPNPAGLPYPQFHASYSGADSDMAFGTQWMSASGFPFLWENTSTGLEIGEAGATWSSGGPALSAPSALFYYGWYNYLTYRDVWEWIPGSCASDLNSNSIQNIRNTSPGSFVATAFRKGLTAGVGVIGEPFLTGHPYPEVFIKYLLDGYTFAEAAAVSDPTQVWMSLYVGDPLYCPLRSGKPLVLDTVAPPVPALSLLASSATEATFELRCDTTGREPDLVRHDGFFGVAPALDQAMTSDPAYRKVQTATLTGLAPGAFYRAALQVKDPVGLATPAPDILFLNDGGTGLAAVVQTDVPAPAPTQPLSLEFAARIPGGAGALLSLQLTADLPLLGVFGIDLLPLLSFFPVEGHSDEARDLYSLEISLPYGLGSGDYVFHLDLATGQGAVQGSLPISVL